VRLAGERLELSATDVSNFLGCRHRIGLELAAAAGTLRKPKFDDPLLEALFARGLEHERRYVESLAAGGRRLVDLAAERDGNAAAERTLEAMRAGADAIVQAALGDGRWRGRPDVLVRVPGRSRFGAWSYEVEDTKLASETRAAAIVQLGLYCELLERAQGARPECFRVVTPRGAFAYRVDDFAAYFRWVRAGLEAAASDGVAAASYPEPCEHCEICPWLTRCAGRRRADDHLSLVAGISRMQRRELEAHGVITLRALAETPLPLPFRPARGAVETYVRVREQARLQLEARAKGPVFELLEVVPGEGLCRLPEPTPGDVFLDLEGAPFAGEIGSGGREYLFGVVARDARGEPVYDAHWAETPAAERAAFERLVDRIIAARAAEPGLHVYHYAPYEPSALKRLSCRHATRERELDALLRAGAFVDLYAVVRQSLRAGVERYSIKHLEPLYGYARAVDLAHARRHLQAVELALEHGALMELDPAVRDAVAGYNRDDCVSALRLRDWLEGLRADRVANGAAVPRPEAQSGEPSEGLDERQQRVAALREQLLAKDERARFLLAYLLDWHRREDKAVWWEYFRLRDLPDEALLDERAAVAGLAFARELGMEKRSHVLRFSHPPQELELRRGDELKLRDESAWGEIVAIDRAARTLDVKVGPSKRGWRPSSAFRHEWVNPRVLEEALIALAEAVVRGAADPLAMQLLGAAPPKTLDVMALDRAVLAIQGPPGAGKTYTGGRMICDLVAAGRKVGITATGHKVIRNLLRAVAHEAEKRGLRVRMAHKDRGEEDGEEDAGFAVRSVDNGGALRLLDAGEVDVVGGTAWLWARPELGKKLDVLFVDEAGQMSLANALAVAQAANSLVLLGDPQQLEQPTKGVHPEGVGVSALQHLLGEHKTMPAGRGVFLPETWRFGSALCRFTSEVFYEGKLRPTHQVDLERQRLAGGPLEGAGLFVCDVAHDGNRNASDEEVEVVARLVERLLAPGSLWVDRAGIAKPMTAADVLVVAPYNAHVSRLADRVPVEVGTVDRFQGREAPVVIYSTATSRPEDAPRGMEFLYSLNRLNVATSRALCAAVVVASPRLFEPDCKSPRQMQLANALCRYRELATPLTL
jgi:predicted RecB family nuclease